MARFGRDHPARTVTVAGVKFMGEAANTISSHKRILKTDLDATFSLELGCPAAEFIAFCNAHPDRTIVVYANTNAAVKARADWMVTSSFDLQIVAHLHAQSKKTLRPPDTHSGNYIQKKRRIHVDLAGFLVGARRVQGIRTGVIEARSPSRQGAGPSRVARSGNGSGRRVYCRNRQWHSTQGENGVAGARVAAGAMGITFWGAPAMGLAASVGTRHGILVWVNTTILTLCDTVILSNLGESS